MSVSALVRKAFKVAGDLSDFRRRAEPRLTLMTDQAALGLGDEDYRQQMRWLNLCMVASDHIKQAELLVVTDEMQVVLDHAASAWDESSPLSSAWLPWQHALVVMGRPYAYGDIDSMWWQAWVNTSDQVARRRTIPLFRLVDREQRDEWLSGMWVNALHLAAVSNVWVPVSMTLWREGEPARDGPDAVQTEDSLRMHKQMAALWNLVQQRIAIVERRHADRALARRWERTCDGPVPTVQVVHLRRPAAHEAEPVAGGPVEWSHRWIVGGHWRNQLHRSTGEHVPTWIAPYVKGPADKPLVVKDRVHVWDR